MSTEQEILVTGIKVVDLLAPYAKGGKIGMERVSMDLRLKLHCRLQENPHRVTTWEKHIHAENIAK